MSAVAIRRINDQSRELIDRGRRAADATPESIALIEWARASLASTDRDVEAAEETGADLTEMIAYAAVMRHALLQLADPNRSSAAGAQTLSELMAQRKLEEWGS